ncbi:hypothetical protein M514_02076 [Trichuris suis]|uniref:Uncharacterized protein n=1 Tax=Trichuris suis TaxID=68888 RepID=A0A085MIZ5_9BILA|nr:hypothetical protein M513_02076 [Trichuris suis]KFD63366.1 hypothetical protein M514_02076 [Trichuris suis]
MRSSNFCDKLTSAIGKALGFVTSVIDTKLTKDKQVNARYYSMKAGTCTRLSKLLILHEPLHLDIVMEIDASSAQTVENKMPLEKRIDFSILSVTVLPVETCWKGVADQYISNCSTK